MMGEKIRTNRNMGLDSLKALCAFMVVCIHAPFPGVLGRCFEVICCLAVPCFFMISGFFYPGCIARKGERNQIIKIVKLTFVSLAAYFVWTFLFFRWTSQDFSQIIHRLLSVNGMFKLIVCNNVNFAYHLWYLLAFLYVLIIVYSVRKLGMKKLLFAAVPFLILVSIVIGRYSEVFLGRFISLDFSRNAYFLGLPFFCIGWFISENREKITAKLNKRLLILLIAVFGMLGPVEYFVLEMLGKGSVGDMYFSTAFFVVSVFVYCAFFSQGKTIFANIGRKFSTSVYIVHVLVIDVLYDIISKTSLRDLYAYVAPFAIYAVSLMIAWVWDKLREKKVA